MFKSSAPTKEFPAQLVHLYDRFVGNTALRRARSRGCVELGKEALAPERVVVAINRVLCGDANESVGTKVSVVLKFETNHLVDLRQSAYFGVFIIRTKTTYFDRERMEDVSHCEDTVTQMSE